MSDLLKNLSGKTTGDRVGVTTDCIKSETIFNVQWSNCPVEVEDEVRDLWVLAELMNDVSYFSWKPSSTIFNGKEEVVLSERFPLIHAYLTSKGVSECLIHWWW